MYSPLVIKSEDHSGGVTFILKSWKPHSTTGTEKQQKETWGSQGKIPDIFF